MQGSSPENAVRHSNIIHLPISSVTNEANDTGVPLSLARPETGADDELVAFGQLAKMTSKELLLLRYADPERDGVVIVQGAKFEVSTLNCSIEAGNDSFSVRLYSESGATKISVPASNLRSRDPKTGEPLSVQPQSQAKGSLISASGDMVTVHKVSHGKTRRHPKNIPTSCEKKGRYGFAVEFEDGATIIYSMHAIALTAAECAP